MNADIAIVGMACRFPGAETLAAFADQVRSGQSALAPIPAERWALCAGNDPDSIGLPNPSAGLVDDIDGIDRRVMRVSGNEAPLVDPLHRLFFETAWTALEDANIAPATLEGQPVGVFAGASNSEYGLMQAKAGFPMANSPYQNTGSSVSVVAGRFSYGLGLTGPVQVLDNACASSHAATIAACESLRVGQCDLAVAGAVNVLLSADVMRSLTVTGVLSKTGSIHCFDQSAGGYVRGEGCGALALRRLDDAIARGDRIHAVIRGWHLRHNGRTNGLTAPTKSAQSASMSAALAAAGVTASEIGYAEAHGTATRLGDLMEATAMDDTIAKDPQRSNPLPIGTVKSCIGHLEAAAGIAGQIKTAIALRDGILPPMPPHQAFPDEVARTDPNLRVPTLVEPWDTSDRNAIIASLGFNGACAHIVMSAYTAPDETDPQDASGLFLVSAACADALVERMTMLAKNLRAWTGPIGPLAQAVSSRWDGMPYRVAIVAKDQADARAQVETWLAQGDAASSRAGRSGPIALKINTTDPATLSDLAPDATTWNAALTQFGVKVGDPSRVTLVLTDSPGTSDAETVHITVADSPRATLLTTLAALWAKGIDMDLSPLWPQASGAHVDLPGYPFQRTRAWALPGAEPHPKEG